MLLQGACAARLGRKLRYCPFIVVALYIENSGRVTRYFPFQRARYNIVKSYAAWFVFNSATGQGVKWC